MPEALMTVDEVAAYLQVPVKTIYAWNHKSTGPRAIPVGRYLRYRRRDVEVWLEQHAEPDPTAA